MSVINALFGTNSVQESQEPEVEAIEMEGDNPEIEMEEEEGEAPIDHEEETHDDEIVDEPVADAKSKSNRQIPISAILDERDKRKEAQRRADELQRELDTLRAAKEPTNDSTVYPDDPYFTEFQTKVQAQFQRQLFEDRLLDSDERMKEKHGEEKVAEAATWAKSRMENDPTFKATFLASRRPMEYLIGEHEKDRLTSDMLSDPDAYVRRRAVELGLVQNDAQSTHTESPADLTITKTKAAPPRSLASAPASGRVTDRAKNTEGSAVDRLFRR